MSGFIGSLFPKKEEYRRRSYPSFEERVRETTCKRFLKKFGWCIMEMGKDDPGIPIYKEYLDANCNQGELNSGKIHASGEGSKSTK